MNKKRIGLKSVAFALVAVLLIAVLLFSLYQALMIYFPQMQEKERYEGIRKTATSATVPVSLDTTPAVTDAEGETVYAEPDSDYMYDYSQLVYRNDDLQGWLRIDDTEIDYPVMKSSEDDPEYYLHRDFDENYSFSGSLFIGEGCDADSDIFIIYGHNMNNGSMFGSLDDYKNVDFAQSHSEIKFDTLTEHRVYRVFAAFESQIYEEPTDSFVYYDAVGNFTQGKYEEAVQHIKDLSLIQLWNEPRYPQQILFLSTCSYHTEQGRFVVAAYRVQ